MKLRRPEKYYYTLHFFDLSTMGISSLMSAHWRQLRGMKGTRPTPNVLPLRNLRHLTLFAVFYEVKIDRNDDF